MTEGSITQGIPADTPKVWSPGRPFYVCHTPLSCLGFPSPSPLSPFSFAHNSRCFQNASLLKRCVFFATLSVSSILSDRPFLHRRFSRPSTLETYRFVFLQDLISVTCSCAFPFAIPHGPGLVRMTAVSYPHSQSPCPHQHLRLLPPIPPSSLSRC